MRAIYEFKIRYEINDGHIRMHQKFQVKNLNKYEKTVIYKERLSVRRPKFIGRIAYWNFETFLKTKKTNAKMKCQNMR